MMAAVIVHRWFEQGAGWAFPPDVQPLMLDVIAALDAPLKTGREGQFQIRVRGNGYLLGNVAPDVGSLDPKATERRPMILRAVLLGREASPEQAATILSSVSSITPVRPGPDVRLQMDVPTALSRARPKPADNISTLNAPRSTTRKKVLIMLAIAIALLAIIFTFQQRTPFGPPKPEDLRPVARRMAAQLSGWGAEVSGDAVDVVIKEYFAFLCQAAVWQDPPNSKHPYVEFVKRLPHRAAQPKEGRWTEQEVATVLSSLVASLEGRRDAGQDAGSTDENLQRVDHLMNYDAWRRHDSKREEGLSRFAIAPEQAVVVYVERFRSSTSADFVPVTDLMRARLAQWRLPMDEKASPFHVLRLFFTTLQRPPFLSKCSRDDKGHAYWRFADRLPEQAASLGWTCDGKEQLDEALRDLLHSLGETSGGKTTEGLIEAIGRQMDYDDWVKLGGRNWNTEGLPQSQELVDFVNMFRPSQPSDR